MESVNARQLSVGISKERNKIGKSLLIAAWGVELLAVAIGLAIAMAAMASSFSEMNSINDEGVGFSGYLNIFIAALPFVMVAGVELTKIPFVGVIYTTTSFYWKVLFSCVLFFLSMITFESALNGFERNFTALTYSIDKFKKDLILLEEKIPLVKESREKSALLTAEKVELSYDLRRKAISESRERESIDVQARISSLRATITSDYIKSKKDERATVQSEMLVLRTERDGEIRRLRDQIQSSYEYSEKEVNLKRRLIQSDINAKRREISALNKKELKELNESFWGKDSIKKEFKKSRSKLEEALRSLKFEFDGLSLADRKSAIDRVLDGKVKAIRDDFSKRILVLSRMNSLLNGEISKSLATREKDIEYSIKQHLNDLKEIEKKFLVQLQQNESERDRKFELLKNNESILSELDSNLVLLGTERAELRDVINRKVGDNQVFRMAQWWFDKESAADLGRNDVMIVAALWFGSLAMMVAFAGPMLAFGSYVIRDEKIKDDKDPSNYFSALGKGVVKATRSIRLYYVEKRKTLRTPITKEVPVEVIREVAVNKIVKVEIPVEVIKKEIVHVPLYTNDPNLLNVDPLIPGDELEPIDDGIEKAANRI